MNLFPHAACLLALGVTAADEPAKPANPTPPGARPPWTTTASGLKHRQLRAGQNGARPLAGDKVQVHYVGTLANGRKFDSSRDRGEPFAFVVGQGQVIKGWDEGLALMTVGSVFEFDIPAALAYGEEGHPPVIPARANLIFEVELLRITSSPKFQPLEPQHTVTTASGLKYQVVTPGDTGSPTPAAAQGATLDFALWNTSGELIASTQTNDFQLSGVVGNLRLARLPMAFLTEAVPLMHTGGELRLEVPARLAFGAQAVDPRLPGNSTTIWQLKLVRVNQVPAFRQPDTKRQQTTASGLLIETIAEGTGARPAAADRVQVHYTGWLADGQVFDSSDARGEPTTFGVGDVIAGWQEGLQLMKEGGTCRLTIPAALAYGDTPPRGSGIPKGATLIFQVRLLKIER